MDPMEEREYAETPEVIDELLERAEKTRKTALKFERIDRGAFRGWKWYTNSLLDRIDRSIQLYTRLISRNPEKFIVFSQRVDAWIEKSASLRVE